MTINWLDPRITGAIILALVTLFTLLFAKWIEYRVSNKSESIDALISKTYAKFKQLLFLNYLSELHYFPTKRGANDLTTVRKIRDFIKIKSEADTPTAFYPFIQKKNKNEINGANRDLLIKLFKLTSLNNSGKNVDVSELAQVLFELDLDQFGDAIPLPHFPRYTLSKISQMTAEEIDKTFIDLAKLAEKYNKNLSTLKKKVDVCLSDRDRQEDFFDYAEKDYPSVTAACKIFNLSLDKTIYLLGIPKVHEGRAKAGDYSRKTFYKRISSPGFIAGLSEEQYDPTKLKTYLEWVKKTETWGDQVKALKLKPLQVKSNLSGYGFEDLIFHSTKQAEIRVKGFNGIAEDLFSTEEFSKFVKKEPFYKEISLATRIKIRIKKLLQKII